MTEAFAFTTSQSTSKTVNLVTFDKEQPDAAVGKLIYFDAVINGEVYRSIGTVSKMLTENTLFSQGFEKVASRGLGSDAVQSTDVRKSSIIIQAVFKKSEDGIWEQYGSALPTSPSTRAKVHLLNEETVNEMLQNASYPTVGWFRGLKGTAVPLALPNYGLATGAKHLAVLGKSGSGKRLSVDTPMPTPNGWTTMGELKDGDLIFDEQGNICTVVKAHEIELAPQSYEVVFSDGSSLKADAQHLWYTETEASRQPASQAKTVASRKNAKRKPLLSESVCSNLRWLASESEPEEVITVKECFSLLGKEGKTPTWLYNLADSMKPVSYIDFVEVKGHTTKPFTSHTLATVYPKREILNHFINNKESIARLRNNRDLVKKLNTELSEASSGEKITTVELRSIFGAPMRLGSFGLMLKNTGIKSETVTVPYENNSITYKPIKAKSSVGSIPQYNKREFLNLVAEYGSRIINDQRGKMIVGSVKTTQEILETLTHISGKKQTWNHSVPVAKAIELPEAGLPIHPYTIGAWLGDGISSNGKICGVDEEILDYIVKNDRKLLSTYIQDNPNRNIPLQTWLFENLTNDLRKLGLLLKNGESVKQNGFPKRIPAIYLRSSILQRKELLAGIMDTDGNATKSASVEFTSVHKDFAYDVHELALSLGYRATIVEKDAKIYGKLISKKYIVRWSTSDDVFKLSRKVKTHRKYSKNYNESKNNQRYIVAVNKIEPTEMRCITVDSPNSLYLAGRNFIPTHNTALSGMLLSAFMCHESHAIFVIDPQGQWANENGMPLSPQKIAKGLGRKVTVLRISEDVRMPMDSDVFGRMMDKLELWKRFRRMGAENRDVFSREVAERIANLRDNEFNDTPRNVLTKIFKDIAYSPSTMSRIYAKGERQEMFRDELLRLIGEPIETPDGEYEIVTQEDKADIERNWESILSAFTPLHSLFSKTNLNGDNRKPLGGKTGFMTEIFKVRSVNDKEPAPYVIIDMSPNIKLHAKAELAQGDVILNMQKVLDNADIKALMLMIILQEMKRASETAFATSFGGNLNTQIVFDEAWRFAPEGKASPEIEELASMLEGFALDTRKFGIGWTYILQSPGDLKTGIWRQLTYVVAGYGLVGDDVKRLESLTDDVEQVELYRQFISPTATNEYPFMFMGPISPLIFSTSPTFLNAFTNVTDFLESNKHWINPIVKKRSLPALTVEYMSKPLETENVSKKIKEEKEYGVGKNYKTSEPQTVIKERKVEPIASKKEGEVAPPPF
jgi:hypothetical protein